MEGTAAGGSSETDRETDRQETESKAIKECDFRGDGKIENGAVNTARGNVRKGLIKRIYKRVSIETSR